MSNGDVPIVFFFFCSSALIALTLSGSDSIPHSCHQRHNYLQAYKLLINYSGGCWFFASLVLHLTCQYSLWLLLLPRAEPSRLIISAAHITIKIFFF
jgi:hypothetical protein